MQACAIAGQYYGLDVVANALYAERDCNFELVDAKGQRSLLKIANADLGAAPIVFQNRVLIHLAAHRPRLPTPHVIPNLKGETQFTWLADDGRHHEVRLLSWLEGECLELADTSIELRECLGRDLAKLGQALSNCPGHDAPTDLPWDLRNTGQLREIKQVCTDKAQLRHVERTLDRFEQLWAPALRSLPHQLIHNDLNPENVLFDNARPRRVSGIIDFGDMVKAPLICDLAVACAYHVRARGHDPVSDLTPMVTGYCSVQPLSAPELALLSGLVECRLLMTCLIQGWRASNQVGTEAAEYRQDSQEAATRLMRFAEIDHAEAGQRLAKMCLAP